MLLYTDIISGDEIFSDAFPLCVLSPPSFPAHLSPSKLIDDIVYEVDCQTITVKEGADIDIGAYHRPGLPPLLTSTQVPTPPMRSKPKPSRMVLPRSTT